MATTDEPSDTEQCRALTDDGERCSRPAQDDGFCYQHDESDETVDDVDETDGGEDESTADDADEETADDQTDDADESEPVVADGQTVETDPDMADEPDIVAVRRAIQQAAQGLIARPLDGVLEVTPEDDGWRVHVEVIERAAVPDTQDILGQYELHVSEDLDIQSYRRIDRYRRSDTDQMAPQ